MLKVAPNLMSKRSPEIVKQLSTFWKVSSSSIINNSWI